MSSTTFRVSWGQLRHKLYYREPSLEKIITRTFRIENIMILKVAWPDYRLMLVSSIIYRILSGYLTCGPLAMFFTACRSCKVCLKQKTKQIKNEVARMLCPPRMEACEMFHKDNL